MNLLMAAGLVRGLETVAVQDIPEYRLIQVPEGEAIRPRIRWAKQDYVSPDVERTMQRLATFRYDPDDSLSRAEILVFRPTQPGESAADAKRSIEVAIQEAVMKTVAKEYRIMRSITPTRVLPVEFDQAKDRYWYDGPGCAMGQCEVRMTWTEDPPFRVPAPDILPYGGMVWLTVVDVALPVHAVTKTAQAVQDESAALPDWAYLYVPPGLGVKPYPVIYHQGRPLYFIAPGA